MEERMLIKNIFFFLTDNFCFLKEEALFYDLKITIIHFKLIKLQSIASFRYYVTVLKAQYDDCNFLSAQWSIYNVEWTTLSQKLCAPSGSDFIAHHVFT